MRDLSSYRADDGLNDQMAVSGNARSLEQTDRAALVPQSDQIDHRTELYTRLRNIIDNATESIRVLKGENAALTAQNAEMTDQIGTLEYRIRTVTADLASDELALRKSAEMLEQVLQGTPTGAVASIDADIPPETADSAPSAMEDDPSAITPPESHTAISEPESEAEPEAERELEPEAEPELEMEAEPEEAMPVMEQAVGSAMADTGPIPQPEPLPAPNEHDEDERVVAPQLASRPDGTYTLIAYPFVRFSDLGQFQAALQKLAGVHDVQVRRFAQGKLEMRIGYSGATDLATTLRTLATEIEDVHEEEPYQLRIRLRTTQDS